MRNNISYDKNYSSSHASKRDAAFQILTSGFLETSKDLSLKFEDNKISIGDNYRFVKKYFSIYSYFYVFVLRIILLKNPFAEFYHFLNNINVNKLRLNNYNYYDDFINYKLKNDKVGVSVIIPTLNRYKYLADVLKDLELQDYKNFEVIVIDQSDNFNKRFYENFNLDIKIKHQKEKKLWKARNYAIKLSKHDFLLFFDDDSRVDSDWILNHLKSLEFLKTVSHLEYLYQKLEIKSPQTINIFISPIK